MALTQDQIFSQIKKFDNKLTREEFDAQYKSNPAAVQAIYESVKPRSIVGSTIKLNDGSEAKVLGATPYNNAPGFYLQTDKGDLTVYSKDFIESGGSYNGNKSYITAVSPEILGELEQGEVSLLSSGLFNDLPGKNNTGLDLSGKDFYVFTDAAASPNLNTWFYEPSSVDDRYEGLYAGGLKLTQGPNGKLYYAGESGGGNQAQVGFLHGDRAGVNRPFTNTPAGSGFTGSGRTVTQKGGLLGKLGASIGKVLDNPLVQLGVSAFGGAPLVGAYNLGKVGGGLATGQLSFGDALKGVATAAAAQGIGNLAGGFSNAVKESIGGAAGSIASNAATGAIKGGIGSLLTGGDLKQGILGGGLGGAIGSGTSKLGDSVKNTVGGTLGKVSGGALQGALGSGIGAALTGRNVLDALKQGAVGGGITSGVGALADYFKRVNAAKGLDSGLSGGLDGVAGDLGNNYGDLVGSGLDGIAGDIGADYLGSTGRNVSLANFLATLNGNVAPGRMNEQPYSTINPLTGKERVDTPSSTPRFNLGNMLLAGGLGAGLVRGLGSLGGPDQQGLQPVAPPAPVPQALNRTLGFQFQAPEYTAGLGGQTLRPVDTGPLLLPAVRAPNYLRQFAEGGEVQAMNSGLGALPMDGRFLQGNGDGMSDEIPANIEGKEDVLLADGEYIIPAQAVSALGNGSSKAGAKVLDAMVKRVYTQQTGKPKQMKPINKKVLPA